MYHFDWPLFWQYLWPGTALSNSLIRNGLIVTIAVSVIAQALGVILGLFAALAKMTKFPPLRWLADAYIWYFRGTPLLVQMSLLYFGLGVTHIYDFPDIHFWILSISGAIQAGTLALGVNEGAYMAEIVRAGIEAIDVGQMEAAKSLGMSYATAMRRIVLPQALKVIIPPLGNEFNNMMKTTSIMVVISAADLFFGYTQVNARLFKPFELFIDASLYYLVLTTVWTFIQARIEAGLGERKSEIKSVGMFERMFAKGGH
ncbi:MAG: amino acid ABC transporter permease [Anaerolineaceae bacterium]|jgi:polar amino acid transport system permease protein